MTFDTVYLKKGRDVRVADTAREQVRLEYEGYKAFDPNEEKGKAAKAVESTGSTPNPKS